jgi:hypothetical protein
MIVSTSSPKVPSLFLLFAGFLCLVATAFAQGSLSDMPSVERIKAEIKGSDATDTLARQLAVFNHLVAYVERIKYNRTVRGPYTPEEQKLYDGYRLAAYQTNQDFEKTHTKAEVDAFGHLEGKYEFDSAFTKDWMSRLIGKQSQDTYRGAEAGLAQSYREHEEKLQQQMKKDQGGGNGIAGDPVLDPMGIFARGQKNMENDPDVRRCLELGSSVDACEGLSGMEAFANLLVPGGVAKSNGPPPVAGVVLVGNYHSRAELPNLSFGAGSATLTDCGQLVAEEHNYTLRKSGNAVQFVLDNEPRAIVVTLNPDGTLSGPGSVLVKGKIITGYSTTTETVMVNGAPAAAQGYYCNGPCSKSTSVPIYAPKTERCTIGSMSYVAPKPVEVPKSGIGFLDAMSTSGPPVTGFRMTGRYAAASGLQLDFATGGVTLDCGKAHVTAPYTVENTASGFVVHVQNAGGAFLLAVAPDNTLRGTGSATVNGRLVSSLHNESVSFAPHSESCAVGTFAARSERNTMIASNGPIPALPSYSPPAEKADSSASPRSDQGEGVRTASVGLAPAAVASGTTASSAASAGSPAGTAGTRAAMRVLISSAFDGGANPVAGEVVWVMRDRMDAVLRSLGAPIPANATPAQAWAAFATACKNTNCSPLLAQLKTHVVTATKLDASGKATISTQAAATGPYYLFSQVRVADGILVWDVPANLVAGDNNVILTPANAEKLRSAAPGR